MNAVDELHVANVPLTTACDSLKVSRASFYRSRRPVKKPDKPKMVRISHRALTVNERDAILDVLHSDRFIDSTPAQVHATLLEEGEYLGSLRTFFRVLSSQDEVRERRPMLHHPKHKVPRLTATAPNQIWSWDITKLRTAVPWKFFHLYAIIDMYSRHIVGWLVDDRECSQLAEQLIETTFERQGISPDKLTLHADRGPSMASTTVKDLLMRLHVTKSHSRPRVSNDNAFSESFFKTLKYCPEFPPYFEDLAHVRRFLTEFFHWYSNVHKHSGIAMLSPAVVHSGGSAQVLEARQQTLDQAYARHPERFSRPPKTLQLPEIVELNPIEKSGEIIQVVE